MPAPTQNPEDLYGLPLEEFVPSRAALVKAMRAAGRRDEASEVAALRKPSVAAWAVNQLARSQRRAISKLLAAGDELQRVQSELLAGQADRDGLALALAQERNAVDELVELARGLLTAAGQELSATTLDRVVASLHAAALEDDARKLVQDGRLVRELEHAGLGGAALPAGSPQASPGQKRGARTKGEHRTKRDDKAKPKAAAQKRAGREQAQRLKAARQLEARARRHAERAGHDLQRAQARHQEAVLSLREAEEAVDTLSQRAEQARAEHGRAEVALREARDSG